MFDEGYLSEKLAKISLGFCEVRWAKDRTLVGFILELYVGVYGTLL